MIKMPLVEYVKQTYPQISLDNVLIIGCQHILATTHSMLQSLYDVGLNPKNIFLLGKCYSSSLDVYSDMLKDGIQVSPLSFFFDSHQPFDNLYFDIVKQFWEDTLSKIDLSKFYKIILMDDGGQLLSLASNSLQNLENIIGIEQTSSGYEKLKNISLNFSVINVARSCAKLIYESPMIAETVIEKLLETITPLSCHLENVLIVGNGAIGSAIYQALNNKYNIEVYDKKKFYPIDFDKSLRKNDLIIGCTGSTSIPLRKHSLLKKGSILFSVSSSDREFDAVHFRRQVKKVENCHENITVENINLLNCGFPINFDGGRNSVSPMKIQLTRALLTTAIFQGCEIKEINKKIIPLNEEIQNRVIQEYLKYKNTN